VRSDVDIETANCSIRFQGQYEDAESGLYYNLNRYYDPRCGMYLSPDPIGLAGGLRPNGYVHNPTTYIDPLGLADEPVTYRGDSRPPELIFSKGFDPKGNSSDLLLHARDNNKPPSAYVSTSTEFNQAKTFAIGSAEKAGYSKSWVYEIHNSGNGVDVNKVLGSNSPFPWETEIAYKGGVKPEQIISATEIDVKTHEKIGEPIRNKSFKPVKSYKICRK